MYTHTVPSIRGSTKNEYKHKIHDMRKARDLA
jgi:hypothetical protein